MKIAFFSLFLFFGNQVYSQGHEVSFNLGYGNCEHSRINSGLPLFVPPPPILSSKMDNVLILGGNYHYGFKEGKLRLNTGLDFYFHNNLGQLNIPVGVNGDAGKRFHFFYGTGLNGKLLLHGTNGNIEYNSFQFGFYYDLGCGYRINERLDLRLNYRMNVGITNSYKTYSYALGSSYPGNLGSPDAYLYKEYAGVIGLGLSYKLKKKK